MRLALNTNRGHASPVGSMAMWLARPGDSFFYEANHSHGSMPVVFLSFLDLEAGMLSQLLLLAASADFGNEFGSD